MKTCKGHADTAQPGLVMGCAWYNADQWNRLREICPDGHDFEPVHAVWLATARKRMAQLAPHAARRGIHLVRVIVDVDELTAWCAIQNLQPDAAARAVFVCHKVSERTPAPHPEPNRPRTDTFNMAPMVAENWSSGGHPRTAL